MRRVGRLLLAGAGGAVALASAWTVVGPVAAPAVAADDAVRFQASRVLADEGDTRVTLRVTRRATVALSEARVAYATEDQEARAGSDYVASRGTIVLGVGQTGAVIDVQLVDDRTNEATERFYVVLTDPDRPGATLDRTWIDVADDDEERDPPLAASSSSGDKAAGSDRSAKSSSVTAPARPGQRPSASGDLRSADEDDAASRQASRTTPFKLYRPAPSRLAPEPSSTSSPVAGLGVVAAVVLACVAARVWHHWRVASRSLRT